MCAVATVGRQGRLVCQSHTPPVGGRLTERAGNCRPRGPACVPWQPPAGKAGLCADLMHRLLASGKRPAEPPCGAHRKLVSRRSPRTSAAVLHGARTPGAGRARTPSGAGARTPTVARARTPEETSCPACWRAPRPVKFLAHAYATCAVMRELDTIMFVRDSCSKQLDSDRLAAYVP